MKTKEELEALKEKVQTLKSELRELTPEELRQVTGGIGGDSMIFTEPEELSDDTKNKFLGCK